MRGNQLNDERNAELKKQFAVAAIRSMPNVGAIAGFNGGTLMSPSGYREPMRDDPDKCLKMLKKNIASGADPQVTADVLERGVRKSEATPSVPTDPVNLIKAAHGNPMAIQDLELGAAGREIKKIEIEKSAVRDDHFFETSDAAAPRPRELRKKVLSIVEAETMRRQRNRRPV